MSKILVQAQEGRTVPIHSSDHTESGLVHVLKPGETLEVENSPGIRRRIRAGDLAVVRPTKAEPSAKAPADMDLATPSAKTSPR